MTQPTHPALARTPEIGDAIGKYRIVGVIGDGSLGRLCLAEQHGIEGVSRTVALLCIRPELAESPHFRALFFDAASIAPRFEHLNVVIVHEMSEAQGSYFVSMEYLAGESVSSLLTRCGAHTTVPPDIAACVVKQAANAVQYLHDRRAAAALPVGLGHGEVDASNVFVTYHGTVKLLSVGLESIRVANGPAASGEHRVDSASPMGRYVMPEQIEDTSDRRTDVFNLGVVLWTCLTGRHPRLSQGSAEPTAGSSPPRMLAPSSVRAGVPEALDAIAMRALSPDPLQRFQSARAMSEALDEYLVRRDSRPTVGAVRRWLGQLFEAQRASLQMRIAQGRDVESALSLLGLPQRASVAPSMAPPREVMRPRELWSIGPAVLSRAYPDASASPGPFEADPGSASQERLAHSSIVVRALPGAITGEPALEAPELPASAASRPRPSRAWLVGVAIVICAAIAVGTAALLLSSDDRSPLRDAPRGAQLAERSGRVDVRSTPEGAAVFVDGEPTGLHTPVVLKGLVGGSSLRLRVEKAGFASQEREIEIVGGAVDTQAFELSASVGRVRFEGAPADARIYVDDVLVAVEADEQVKLSAGRHRVRVETPGALFFSGEVVIVAGEQTVRVDPAGVAP